MASEEVSVDKVKAKDMGKAACEEEWKEIQQKYPNLSRFQFTPEEKAVFEKCKHNSFWYRAVPISLTVMAGTHYAVSKGYLRANRYVGSLVKVVGFGTLAYMLGRASYIPTCRKKIMALENSEVAEAFKVSRFGPWGVMMSKKQKCPPFVQQSTIPAQAESKELQKDSE